MSSFVNRIMSGGRRYAGAQRNFLGGVRAHHILGGIHKESKKIGQFSRELYSYGRSLNDLSGGAFNNNETYNAGIGLLNTLGKLS